MLFYVGRRLLQFVPTFLGATLIVFLLLQMAPGDPVSLQTGEMVGGELNENSLRLWRELKGLDRPLVSQYAHWLASFVSFDFGRSLFDERPVRTIIWEALPRTVLVTGLALIFIYLFGVPLGIFSAARRGRAADRAVTAILFLLYSLPVFWVALLLIVFLGGGEFLSLFPIRGLQSDGAATSGWLTRGADLAWHLALPVLCLTYPALARTSRLQRTAMLEVLGQDYIRTARAKGLTERAVLMKHALKNSLLPIVTLFSVDLPWLIGGSVIIERIFTIHGMGMLTFLAIQRRDYPVIMGVCSLVAIVTMVAVLAGDLVLAWLDPRIRFGERRR